VLKVDTPFQVRMENRLMSHPPPQGLTIMENSLDFSIRDSPLLKFRKRLRMGSTVTFQTLNLLMIRPWDQFGTFPVTLS
jgi:hypothetical protein